MALSDNDVAIRIRLAGAKAAGAEAAALEREIRGLGPTSQRTERRARGMGRGFVYARKGLGPLRAGVSGLAGALGLTAGLGLAGAFKVSYEEALQARQGHRAVAAELKATHGAAHVSASGVDALSTRLGHMAAVDDDVVRQGELMLLSFRNIRNEAGRGNKIFDQTSKAAVNMASFFQAAGKDMSITDAMLQLGKAVNDPTKGMTRLQRIGVTFTQQQIDQAKALEASGHHLAAQKIILRELNKEFGGAGAAQARANPVQAMSVAFRDLAQSLGVMLLPFIDKLATKMRGFATDVTQILGDKNYSAADKIQQILTRAFGFHTTQQIVGVARTIKSIALAAWPVVRALGRLTLGVAKFAGKHPALVKLAAGVWLVHRAFTRLGGGVIGSVVKQIWRLSKVAAPAVARFGAWMLRRFGVIGTNAGRRAATRAGTTTGAWSAAGKVLGRALGLAAAAMIGYYLGKALSDFLHNHPKVAQFFPGTGDTTSPFTTGGIQSLIDRSRGSITDQMRSQQRGSHPIGTTGGPGGPRARGPLHKPFIAVPQPAVGTAPAPAPVPTVVVYHETKLDGKVLFRSMSKHAQDRANRQ